MSLNRLPSASTSLASTAGPCHTRTFPPLTSFRSPAGPRGGACPPALFPPVDFLRPAGGAEMAAPAAGDVKTLEREAGRVDLAVAACGTGDFAVVRELLAKPRKTA